MQTCGVHNNCLSNFPSRTINRVDSKAFWDRDKGYKSETVLEIPGQLEPMQWCVTWNLYSHAQLHRRALQLNKNSVYFLQLTDEQHVQQKVEDLTATGKCTDDIMSTAQCPGSTLRECKKKWQWTSSNKDCMGYYTSFCSPLQWLSAPPPPSVPGLTLAGFHGGNHLIISD